MDNVDGTPGTVYLRTPDNRYLELFHGGTEPATEPGGRAVGYSHLCLEVDDLEQATAYLDSKGVPIRVRARTGRARNIQCWVDDPDGKPNRNHAASSGLSHSGAAGRRAVRSGRSEVDRLLLQNRKKGRPLAGRPLFHIFGLVRKNAARSRTGAAAPHVRIRCQTVHGSFGSWVSQASGASSVLTACRSSCRYTMCSTGCSDSNPPSRMSVSSASAPRLSTNRVRPPSFSSFCTAAASSHGTSVNSLLSYRGADTRAFSAVPRP